MLCFKLSDEWFWQWCLLTHRLMETLMGLDDSIKPSILFVYHSIPLQVKWASLMASVCQKRHADVLYLCTSLYIFLRYYFHIWDILRPFGIFSWSILFYASQVFRIKAHKIHLSSKLVRKKRDCFMKYVLLFQALKFWSKKSQCLFWNREQDKKAFRAFRF